MSANFLPTQNGELHDWEIIYSDHRVPFSSAATETHIVKGVASLKNALSSFNRAVPQHGRIKSVRKLGI
jgi:hypothetical protein